MATEKNEVEVLSVPLATWLGVTLLPPAPPHTAEASRKKVRHFSEEDKQEAFRRIQVKEFAQDLNFRTR